MEEEVKITTLIVQHLLSHIGLFLSVPPGYPVPQLPGSPDLRECLSILRKHLCFDGSPYRVQLLAFHTTDHLLPCLYAYLAKLSTPHYEPVKIDVINTLVVIVTLCACDALNEEESAQDESYEARHFNAQQLCNSFIQHNIIQLLFAHVNDSGASEALAVVAVECIFVFFMRNPMGVDAVVQSGGVEFIMKILLESPYLLVRNYCSLLLRQISEKYNKKIAAVQNWEYMFVKLLQSEISPDVKCLTLQTLRTVFRRNAQAFAQFSKKMELVTVLRIILDNDVEQSVQRAVFPLLENAFLIEASVTPTEPVFIDSCMHCAVQESLVKSLGQPLKVSSLAARALRFYVQYSPPSEQLGHRIVTDESIVRPIINSIIGPETNVGSAGSIEPNSATAAQLQRVFDVELSVTLAMCFAMNPKTRAYMKVQLQHEPEWLHPLRNYLLQHLQRATESYYTDITIVDCTGRMLTDIQAVGWMEYDQPDPESLQALYVNQEQAVYTGSVTVFHGSPSPLPSHYIETDNASRSARLVLALLRFAVVLALPERSEMEESPRRTLAEFNGETSNSRAAKHLTGQLVRKGYSVEDEDLDDDADKENDMKSASDVGPSVRFDRTMLLVLQFAQYYAKEAPPKPTYRPTGDGFMIRNTKRRNFWNLPHNMNKIRRWSLNDVRQDDFFEFDLEYRHMNTVNIEKWLYRSRKHFTKIHKMLLTTPQSAKGRRWFLYDMMYHVLPPIQELFASLLTLLQTHGFDNVQFALHVFKAKDIQRGERSLHCGNIIDIVDQLQYYFKHENTGRQEETSTALRHLDDQVRKLQMSDALQAEESEDELNDGLLDNDEEEAFSLQRARKHLASTSSNSSSPRRPMTVMSGVSQPELTIEEELVLAAGKRALQYAEVASPTRRREKEGP